MEIGARNETHCQSENLLHYTVRSVVCIQKELRVTNPLNVLDEVKDTMHYRQAARASTCWERAVVVVGEMLRWPEEFSTFQFFHARQLHVVACAGIEMQFILFKLAGPPDPFDWIMSDKSYPRVPESRKAMLPIRRMPGRPKIREKSRRTPEAPCSVELRQCSGSQCCTCRRRSAPPHSFYGMHKAAWFNPLLKPGKKEVCSGKQYALSITSQVIGRTTVHYPQSDCSSTGGASRPCSAATRSPKGLIPFLFCFDLNNANDQRPA